IGVIFMTGNKEVITGNDYKRMIAGAYSAFLLEYENINALNGESLLDRKAGTHILRTIGAAAMSLRDLQAESIGGVSKRVGSAAILGARGNAGVLISQILRGIAKGLSGKYEASSSVFGKSFQYGILYAQRAVNDEVERPIIITAKAVAKGAYNAVRANLPITEILTEAIKAGGIALSQVEHKCGFVDAGAKALMVFLQGCRNGLDGYYVSPVLLFSSGFKTSHDVPNPRYDLVYPYAVSCRLEKCRASKDDLAKMLKPMGKVIVIKSESRDVLLYLHTDYPGNVLEQAVDWGTMEDVKIQNLAMPHNLKSVDKTMLDVAVLAIADDEASAQALEELGAIAVITKDKVSGPSVGDLINLIHSDIAKNYIIMANNVDNSLVMAQAKRLLNNNIEILYSTNLEEQIKALKVFNPEIPMKENIKNMNETLNVQ
ncbi:MAG TPA: DAK2 domain-containing protein, partial [Megamonas hypermegale]|nr:DAK2 domain-containing protein [Megamonas hypermegale]